MWLAKFLNHEFRINHAIGQAIKFDIMRMLKNPFINNVRISETDAPNTFLIPISFVRRIENNEVTAHMPMQLIIIVSMEKIQRKLLRKTSFLY